MVAVDPDTDTVLMAPVRNWPVLAVLVNAPVTTNVNGLTTRPVLAVAVLVNVPVTWNVVLFTMLMVVKAALMPAIDPNTPLIVTGTPSVSTFGFVVVMVATLPVTDTLA